MHKFKIIVGRLFDGKVDNGKQAGTAIFEDDLHKSHYRMQFWQFPKEEFFLVKNKDQQNFTLFSNKTQPDTGGPVFQKPIGYGYVNENLNGYIQVQLNFPWQKCFIALNELD